MVGGDKWIALTTVHQTDEIGVILFTRKIAGPLHQLLHSLYLPNQQSGTRRFQNVLDDEKAMAALFEKFVLNFARKHVAADRIWGMQMKWQGEISSVASEFIPVMKTDVTIDRPVRKTILDCKFYRSALKSSFGKPKASPDNLYQLTAYLRNKAVV